MLHLLSIFFLFILVTCDNFFRNHISNLSSQIASSTNAVAMSPHTVKSYFGQDIDIAVGTAEGSIYFLSKDYSIQYYSAAVPHSISKLEWSDVGLHIASKYQILTVNPELYNWTLVGMTFTNMVYNADFHFHSQNKTIFTAVSFQNRLQLFLNSTSIFNHSLQYWCQAMAYSQSGELFYFMSQQTVDGKLKNNLYELNLLDRSINKVSQTKKKVNAIVFLKESQNVEQLVTVGEGSMIVWGANFSQRQFTTPSPYKSAYFTENSDYFVGEILYKKFGSIKTSISTLNQINSQTPNQIWGFDDEIRDMEVKNGKVLIITSTSQLYFFSNIEGEDDNDNSMPVWSIVIICIVGVILCGSILLGICNGGTVGSGTTTSNDDYNRFNNNHYNNNNNDSSSHEVARHDHG